MADIPEAPPFDVTALGTRRVLVMGDVMLDRFVTGQAQRLSPEAPVPVLRVGHQAQSLGGAGNVVRNLTALGVSVRFAAVIGSDTPGRAVAQELERETLCEPFLTVAQGYTTPEKVRFLTDQGHYLLRADTEDGTDVGEDGRAQVLSSAVAALDGMHVVILSDYAKGSLAPDVLSGVIKAAGQSRIPVIVDPKGRDFTRYRGARLLTPNFREFCAACDDVVPEDEAALITQARELIARCEVGGILITRGAEGMTLIEGQDGEVSHFPAQAREVSDVTGAGDTVVAVLSAMMATDAAAAHGARIANYAAGVVVSRPGTAVLSRQDLLRAVQPEISAATPKVCVLDDLLDRVAALKAQGRVVGFTNGCFDLLHPGHIHLLRQARQVCDHLIVGLNTDDSVQRLKGPDRPIQAEAARALVLASLADVDSVCLFDEDTPLSMIKALMPDVLVKGADYAPDQVVGAKEVTAAGGRLVLADLRDGFSTSATISRLAKQE